MNTHKTNKIALLGALAVALLIPQQAQAWSWKTAVGIVTGATIIGGGLYWLWPKNEEPKQLEPSKDELKELLNDTDCFNAIHLTHEKDIHTALKKSIEHTIQVIKNFWSGSLKTKPFADNKEILNNEQEYLKFVEELFEKTSLSYADEDITEAQTLKAAYWEKFNEIKKEKADLNYIPIKYALKFTWEEIVL